MQLHRRLTPTPMTGNGQVVLRSYQVHLQHESLMGSVLNQSVPMFVSQHSEAHRHTTSLLKPFVDLPCCSTFPYRSVGAACFVCEVDGEVRGTLPKRYRCLRCPAVAFEELGPKLIEHMGGHILFDQNLRDKHNVCGLCLSIGLCEIRLARGAGGSEVVDISRSHCPNLFKIKLKNARKSTKHSPCTNTPLHCPYCDSNAAPVWKYSLSRHIDILHPSANKARFEELWRIDDEESTQISTKFKMKARKRKQMTATSMLRISEEHSSRVALRQQQTTDHYTTESVADSESAQTSLAQSSSAILLGKRLRGLSDASDSQDVPSAPKPRLTIKIRPSAARVSSVQVKNRVIPDSDADTQPDDPLQDEFCWCRGPESGEMVQSSFDSCNEWFHFECVGLLDAPEADWFCSDMCRSNTSSQKKTK